MLGTIIRLAIQAISTTVLLSAIVYAGWGTFLLWEKAAAFTRWSAATSESAFFAIITLAVSVVVIKALCEIK